MQDQHQWVWKPGEQTVCWKRLGSKYRYQRWAGEPRQEADGQAGTRGGVSRQVGEQGLGGGQARKRGEHPEMWQFWWGTGLASMPCANDRISRGEVRVLGCSRLGGAHSAKVGDAIIRLEQGERSVWCSFGQGGGQDGGHMGCLWVRALMGCSFGTRWHIVQPRWGTQWGCVGCLWMLVGCLFRMRWRIVRPRWWMWSFSQGRGRGQEVRCLFGQGDCLASVLLIQPRWR